MNFAALALLPAALLLDRLFGEPPNRIHPVCLMGALAGRIESLLRCGPNGMLLFLAGGLACLLTVLPCAAAAGGIVLTAQWYGGQRAGWLAAVLVVYVCLAPRSLAEHAQRVALPLLRNDLEGARRAVSMIVGRKTTELDAHGVARACVESVAENLTDGVLSTLFWAGVGLVLWGLPGAAALAALHRSANILDALWGKKNETYIRFGTFAARLDDALNLLPARLSLPCIALGARLVPGLRHGDILRVGWKYHAAHESPNSAWSEAAFAGALGLKLGGPAVYGGQIVRHPWLGEGTPDAEPRHIILAIRLLQHSTAVFTLCELFVIGMLGIGLEHLQ